MKILISDLLAFVRIKNDPDSHCDSVDVGISSTPAVFHHLPLIVV